GTFSVGLGLTHARSLVQALGGRISIEETSSAGTVFRLEFPPHLFQPRRENSETPVEKNETPVEGEEAS
ncbi:MAG: ATP-binding protein, partial [Firmicutes bacterium]|nr:ATP-binding protein [Bacillota bacterium]